MTMTRRQLGWWTTAALLTPSVALAGGGVPRQQAIDPGPEPTGLDALSYALEVVERRGETLTFALHVTNASPRALSAMVDVSQVELRKDGGEPEHGFGWVNDAHPFSRRIVAPAWVDLPGSKTLVMAQVHVMADPASWQTAQLTLGITDEKGRTTTLTPAPFPLDVEVGHRLTIGAAERSTS